MPTVKTVKVDPKDAADGTPIVVRVKQRSSTWSSVTSFVSAAAVVLLAAGGAFLGYRLVRADIAASVYKQRLAAMAGDYQALRDRYAEAVARTAVTELVVDDNKLSVRVRSAEGEITTIPAPFDPSGEIYVDYVVVGQRLWIRRVFDARTPPERGLVIDPSLARIDWSDPNAAHGKAVYRRLGEGRWVITVTGDGSLGLARATDEVQLANSPAIKDYSKVPEQTQQDVERIGASDVWRWLTSEKKTPTTSAPAEPK
jgi:hypothetical protein